MLEFFRRLFAPEPRSSDTAKERLRLVLLSDHLSLAPEVVEALKSDLLAVISRYLEIDPAQADVTFEQREREVAMLASIPIVGVRERPGSAAVATPGAAQTELAPPEELPAVAPEPALAQPPAVETQPAAAETHAPAAASAGEALPAESVAPAAEHLPAAAGSEVEQAPVEAEQPVSAPQGEQPVSASLEASTALAAPEPSGRGVPGTSSSARRRRRKKAAAAAKRSPQGHAAPGFGPA